MPLVRVVPEFDIFASSTGVFNIFTLDHMNFILRHFPAALALGHACRIVVQWA